MMEEECRFSSSDSFKEAEVGTPLSAVVEAFEELAKSLEGSSEDLRLHPFLFACSHVSDLFGCLGLGFKFAEIEYVSKVNKLLQASKAFYTLSGIIDHDVRNGTIRKSGSHSRNLRRVRLGLDLIKALFEQFLSSKECSPKEAASNAYAQVCAPYHTWPVRKAVAAGMCTLPTREQLLLKLQDIDQSVEREMKRYINASTPIIEYIDNLYLSRDICLDCYAPSELGTLALNPYSTYKSLE
ncbi:ACD11 homolog protein isoform X1 [Dendrobium catenatum]|uniref:ACD11 homolog protein isoform X1 n=1 Tax=Dendrobium catenatum TaxID=906689 RepID=UPI0010A02B07|nr:ACD11 homolog protein isoform X1 [Dendrobium catenatum]